MRKFAILRGSIVETGLFPKGSSIHKCETEEPLTIVVLAYKRLYFSTGSLASRPLLVAII